MARLDALHRWLRAGIATARRSRSIRNSAGIGGLTGAELALGLVTAILMARALGAEGLGTYSLALAAVVLAGLPVEFGLPLLVMREIAHHDIDSETGLVKGVLIFAVVVIAMMSVVIIPLALITGDSLVPGLGGAEHAMLPVAVGLIPLSAFGNTLGAALAGKQMVVIGALPQKLVRPGVFAIALFAAAVASPGWLTPTRAMGLQLMAAAAAVAFGGLHFARHFRDPLKRSPTRILWRSWSVATLRLGLTNGIRLAEGQILLLVTGTLSSTENVGLLRIAQRGAGLASLGTSISIVAFASPIARLNAVGSHDSVQRLLTQIARAGSAVALIGLVGFTAGGHWLLDTFFGAEFIPAWSALIILAAAETLRALLGPSGMLMIMLRHEGIAVLGLALSLAASASIATALVPVFGADGAAWGTFFGVTGMSLFLCQKARSAASLDPTAFGWLIQRERPGDRF